MNRNSDVSRTDKHQPALGQAIRELRQKRGATLKEIAPKAGITFGTLALIERGESNPTWSTINGIAGALEISVAELATAVQTLEAGRQRNIDSRL
jgi:transcriptional regulator with XRE-family HTH domain